MLRHAAPTGLVQPQAGLKSSASVAASLARRAPWLRACRAESFNNSCSQPASQCSRTGRLRHISRRVASGWASTLAAFDMRARSATSYQHEVLQAVGFDVDFGAVAQAVQIVSEPNRPWFSFSFRGPPLQVSRCSFSALTRGVSSLL